MAVINGRPNTNVTGTNQDDEIHLNGKADAHGRAGDDTIYGSDAANKIYGQDGNDSLYGGAGNDLVDGGNGGDAMIGGTGTNKLYGRDGSDSIFSQGIDSAWGGPGGDTLTAYNYFDYIPQPDGNPTNPNPVKFYGEAGDDWLFGGLATDFLDGGTGNDTVRGSMSDTLRGGSGNDHIYYSSDYRFTDQVTQASEGVISGGAGHDILTLFVGLELSSPHIEVFMTGESAGTVTIDDLPKLTFTGINEIIDPAMLYESNSHMTYHGENADTNMTVRGGDAGTTFIGGKGNEVFYGGNSDDTYIFPVSVGKMGHDQIFNFGQEPDQQGGPYTLGFDTIYYDLAGTDDGPLTTVQTEFHHGPTDYQPSGWDATRYESYDADGRLVHTLEVDAINLPPISYDLLMA
jgi:Ca2+-binding RTX toxin-like protein